MLLTFSAGAAKCQSGVHLIFDLNQSIKNHWATTIWRRTKPVSESKMSRHESVRADISDLSDFSKENPCMAKELSFGFFWLQYHVDRSELRESPSWLEDQMKEEDWKYARLSDPPELNLPEGCSQFVNNALCLHVLGYCFELHYAISLHQCKQAWSTNNSAIKKGPYSPVL